jgi:hypothetical protein
MHSDSDDKPVAPSKTHVAGVLLSMMYTLLFTL